MVQCGEVRTVIPPARSAPGRKQTVIFVKIAQSGCPISRKADIGLESGNGAANDPKRWPAIWPCSCDPFAISEQSGRHETSERRWKILAGRCSGAAISARSICINDFVFWFRFRNPVYRLHSDYRRGLVHWISGIRPAFCSIAESQRQTHLCGIVSRRHCRGTIVRHFHAGLVRRTGDLSGGVCSGSDHVYCFISCGRDALRDNRPSKDCLGYARWRQ